MKILIKTLPEIIKRILGCSVASLGVMAMSVVVFTSCSSDSSDEENESSSSSYYSSSSSSETPISSSSSERVEPSSSSSNDSKSSSSSEVLSSSSSVENYSSSVEMSSCSMEDNSSSSAVISSSVEQSSSSLPPNVYIFIDSRDGREYKVKDIGGDVTWFLEDLAYNSQTKKYIWYEAMEACPDGWHLPTSENWNSLSYLSTWFAHAEEFSYSSSGIWWSVAESGIEFANIWAASLTLIKGEDFKTESHEVRCVNDGLYIPPLKKSLFVDNRDGTKYKTAKIGSFVWMTENLNYEIDNSWCFNCEKYGRLYDWETAMKACPNGWHLPSNEEWDDLILNAGDDVAGKKLKSAEPNWNGTDDFGFSALPGGHYIDDNLDAVSYRGYWWSSNIYDNGDDNNDAYCQMMRSERDFTLNINADKSDGHSVRCVKD